MFILVAGDICGKKNDRITINGTEIGDSGKDLEGKKYLNAFFNKKIIIVGALLFLNKLHIL